ncbi:MAG TPA: LamG-like jellyroll fold domain-containing protein, partial [Roseimicrobium sp.]|nr:LamG-like jellyroll fold domain-containing protein [Roseimicrobium sp.]
MKTRFSIPIRFWMLLAAVNAGLLSGVASAATYSDIVLADKPVAYWRFNAAEAGKVVNAAPATAGFLPDGVVQGDVGLQQQGPPPGLFPDFTKENSAAVFKGKSGYVRVQDKGADSPLKFRKGDSITISAWVAPVTLASGQQVYIVGKGRTENKGFAANNQNYALRLCEEGGQAKVGFLFRDERNRGSKDPESQDDWHRWVSKIGFAAGSGWHHVAVTYTFGEGKSIKGFVDGVPTDGKWDYGGATDLGPVVDDDEVWIGSSMGAKPGGTFNGLMDEIAIYRTALPSKTLAKHFRFVAPKYEVAAKDLPADAVRVEIVENIGGNASWSFVAPPPVETYLEPAFGFGALPQKYTDKGVRADRSAPFMVRAAAKVKLGAGEHRLLLRALQTSRLYIDGQLLVTTKTLTSRQDGHEEVTPIPGNLPVGLRFLRMGQDEEWLTVKSDGREHVFVLEALVGGKGVRPEIGELTITVANKDGSFTLLAPKAKIPHTDEGWTAYMESRLARIAEMNQQNRTTAPVVENAYWKTRHEMAKQTVGAKPGPVVPQVAKSMPVNNEIDRFIAARLEEAKVQPAPLTDDSAFLRRVAMDTTGLPP